MRACERERERCYFGRMSICSVRVSKFMSFSSRDQRRVYGSDQRQQKLPSDKTSLEGSRNFWTKVSVRVVECSSSSVLSDEESFGVDPVVVNVDSEEEAAWVFRSKFSDLTSPVLSWVVVAFKRACMERFQSCRRYSYTCCG